ncbi:MAG TPA: hypothetical protein VJC18_11105, partial [bacterium]|nr:hypothetical protein [bacterium]
MKKTLSVGITILFVGSLWGFLEATLGGLLHLSPLPIAGKIMAPIGFTLLYWAQKNGLKASHLFLAACLAACFKFADVFLFNMPLFSIQIINPAQAIVMQGLCFAGLVKIFPLFDRSHAKLATTSLVFSVHFVLSAAFSLLVFNRVMGAFDIGPLATAIHAIVGTALTAVGLFAIQWTQSRTNVWNVSRLPFAYRFAGSLALVIIGITIRGLIGWSK